MTQWVFTGASVSGAAVSGAGKGDGVVVLGVHKNKRQLHRDMPTTRHHQLRLDPVGHQDCQHTSLLAPSFPTVLEARLVSSCLSLPIQGKTTLLPVVIEQQGYGIHLQNVEVGDTWSFFLSEPQNPCPEQY